ncbi:endolytic transglycosylase MltG [Maribellus mangrovi]|uniref:endolytic transglycosylase MltG n=1 Tax=Maribellus mangrovi TaxID=3133146 RepID=UPI0030EECDEB
MSIEQKSKAMTFPRLGRLIIIVFAIAFIIVGARAYQLYHYVFDANVRMDYVLLIKDSTTYDQLVQQLQEDEVLDNYKAFRWVSKKKNFRHKIKPGRYELQKDMTTNALVNKLRSRAQDPVDVVFNNVRLKEDLAGKVSKYIWADSTSIIKLFSDTDQIEEWGFNSETFRSMFIPNTYEMYWTTEAHEFAERMNEEYYRFWNVERKEKAEAMNLSPAEVTTLASIVEQETAKRDEMPRVAGLYINRLNRGILLQADPTVKYALGDFGIKRVLNKHLEIDSPYNTYKYAGLPPGPISFPSISAIDAVLHHEDNNFIYMCAKEDFSGYHNFAATLTQHNRNAAKYRAALDKNKIYK